MAPPGTPSARDLLARPRRFERPNFAAGAFTHSPIEQYPGRIQVRKETPSHHIGKDGAMAGDCIRLTAVERVKIELGLRDGLSLTAIAAELGRPKGTMSKEIARKGGRDTYDAGALIFGWRMRRAAVGGTDCRRANRSSKPWRVCCGSGGRRSR